MTADDDIRRAEHAKAILGDELVQEAFAEVEALQIAAWRASPVRDAEGREKIWYMLKGAEAFKAFFENTVENGKMAAAKIEADKRETL